MQISIVLVANSCRAADFRLIRDCVNPATPSCWDRGLAPGKDDNVLIPPGRKLSMEGAWVVNSIKIEGSLDIIGKKDSLTVEKDLSLFDGGILYLASLADPPPSFVVNGNANLEGVIKIGLNLNTAVIQSDHFTFSRTYREIWPADQKARLLWFDSTDKIRRTDIQITLPDGLFINTWAVFNRAQITVNGGGLFVMRQPASQDADVKLKDESTLLLPSEEATINSINGGEIQGNGKIKNISTSQRVSPGGDVQASTLGMLEFLSDLDMATNGIIDLGISGANHDSLVVHGGLRYNASAINLAINGSSCYSDRSEYQLISMSAIVDDISSIGLSSVNPCYGGLTFARISPWQYETNQNAYGQRLIFSSDTGKLVIKSEQVPLPVPVMTAIGCWRWSRRIRSHCAKCK